MKEINNFFVASGMFVVGVVVSAVLVNVGLVHDCQKNGTSQLFFGGSLKCEVVK